MAKHNYHGEPPVALKTDGSRSGLRLLRERPSGQLNRFVQSFSLEASLFTLALALGAYHAWLGRAAMDPDGMSYLDVGQSFFRHDWANAVNGWWSPLYPWTVGLALGIAKPSPRWEFPLTQVIDFGIFVLALLAFSFLLHGLIDFWDDRDLWDVENKPRGEEPRSLPKWMLLLLGYAAFLWITMEVDPPWYTTPDLAVLACVCWSSGMLLRLRRKASIGNFALFGVILGVGYWTKAILFPLGFVTLVCGYWWRRHQRQWGRRMAVAAVFFLCACAPLIFLLSRQKARFTFGDSGKFNYAWYVSPRTFWRNWQGAEPSSGTPVHPTRQLLSHPPVFEFDGPVAGTYPPWTDPSYWNEGLKWHFKVKPQLEVLAGTVPSEARLLLRSRPDMVAAVVILALLSGSIWLTGLRALWPFPVIAMVGMGLYLPLVENDRYLGGFVLLLFLTLLAAVRLPAKDRKSAACVAVSVFCTMMLATADYTVRVATHHLAIPGSGPSSTAQDVKAAEQLWKMGLHPGDKVAVIMNGTGAYWAHLAKLRIVAEIMGTDKGATEFWNSSPEVQHQVFEVFKRSHAALAVTSCSALALSSSWEPISGTPYCTHTLE